MAEGGNPRHREQHRHDELMEHVAQVAMRVDQLSKDLAAMRGILARFQGGGAVWVAIQAAQLNAALLLEDLVRMQITAAGED